MCAQFLLLKYIIRQETVKKERDREIYNEITLTVCRETSSGNGNIIFGNR